jgi:hypothetical protein
MTDDSEQREWYMELAHKRAVDIVCRHAAAIRSIAAELAEHREVSGDRVRELFSEAQKKRPLMSSGLNL